jgi:hypothetical protein
MQGRRPTVPAVLLLFAFVAPPVRGVDAGPAHGNEPPPHTRESRPDAVLTWNGVALDLIRVEHTPPPMAARQLAMLHGAIYDAVNVAQRTHRPYRVHLRAIQEINPHVAAACAAHGVLRELYPRHAARLDHLRDSAIQAAAPGGARSRGVSLGQYVAVRILAWRRGDGADRTKRYVPAAELGVWQPTPPGYKAALYPHWDGVTPFCLRNPADFRPLPPPVVRSDELLRDLEEVRSIGSLSSRTRSAEQTIIAWFWDDSAGTCTPPGHWNLIAQEAALDRGLSMADNARLFALLNFALADAGVVCWEAKYRYRLWRPVTAIRAADRIGDPKLRPDPAWLSLLTTPPFPSFPSGHSTFSGAAAGVLERFFGGDQLAFTVGTDGIPGTFRSYKGFWEAAREAGRSRIYGGIHYECDNREGLAAGKAIAEEVFRSLLLPEQATVRIRSPAGPRRERP